jgi:hypothetical protein
MSSPPEIPRSLHKAPPFGLLITVHLVGLFLQALGTSVLPWLIPLLARLHFGAADWQTAVITASLPTLLIASIFWNELLRRMPLSRYLALYALVAIVPLGAIALVHSYAQLLICHLLICVGNAGWTPVSGSLLQRFYPERVRGRAWGLLSGATVVSNIGTVLVLGRWMRDREAFRTFLPGVMGLQATGVALLLWLAHRVGVVRPTGGATGLGWSTVLAPILHMKAILRENRKFLRYEQAFMTYGVGFMLCDVLLPLLGTKRLGLDYEGYADFLRGVFLTFMLLASLPMGWLVDRLGPARTSALAFAGLTLYPLGLILATGSTSAAGVTSAAIASAWYGITLTGVNMGWMLGPVTLAPTPDKVAHYMAVHTTLVGFRGIFAQGLGIVLYMLTGSFAVPLLMAAAAFVWAAIQMRGLSRDGLATAAAPPAVPESVAEAVVADAVLVTAEAPDP